MSEIVNTVGKFAGDAPNEIWTRTGQILALLGGGSFVGVNAGGVAFGAVNGYAPLLLLFLGGASAWYGTQKRKTLSEVQHQETIELARESIGSIFPRSRGVDSFVLEMLAEPQSREELANAETFSEFKDLSVEQLCGLLHQSYAERGQLRGVVVYDHHTGKFVATDKAYADQTVMK